jgi:hypothetical protein
LNVVETLRDNEMVEWLAQTFYNMLNLIKRSPQSTKIQDETVTIITFTDVVTKWLTIPNSTLKELLMGLLQYMLVYFFFFFCILRLGFIIPASSNGSDISFLSSSLYWMGTSYTYYTKKSTY